MRARYGWKVWAGPPTEGEAIGAQETIPVMPVAEHEAITNIYTDALQRIVDHDRDVDALRVASKALGDANEYRNTGTVRYG